MAGSILKNPTLAIASRKMFGSFGNTSKANSSGTWDESLHPRHPAGDEKGGEFAKKTDAQVNSMNINQLQDYLRRKYSDLKTLFLSEDKGGIIKIDMIEINKSERGQGLGSAIMNDIINYADANNKEINLVPALKDDMHGTTSRNRLVKFYKRFGFIENKGRNIDFSKTSGSMIRKPQK